MYNEWIAECVSLGTQQIYSTWKKKKRKIEQATKKNVGRKSRSNKSNEINVAFDFKMEINLRPQNMQTAFFLRSFRFFLPFQRRKMCSTTAWIKHFDSIEIDSHFAVTSSSATIETTNSRAPKMVCQSAMIRLYSLASYFRWNSRRRDRVVWKTTTCVALMKSTLQWKSQVVVGFFFLCFADDHTDTGRHREREEMSFWRQNRIRHARNDFVFVCFALQLFFLHLLCLIRLARAFCCRSNLMNRKSNAINRQFFVIDYGKFNKMRASCALSAATWWTQTQETYAPNCRLLDDFVKFSRFILLWHKVQMEIVS